MRLVMTLLVRDEEAIVRQNIEYHLSRGVDFVIATDNLSRDGTPDILREFERMGVLRYLYEPGNDHSQDLWVSRMATLAHAEHGADWLIHVDADEFWWPESHPDIRQALASVDAHVPAVAVPRCNFLRAREAAGAFHAAMRWREVASKNPLGQPLPGKLAHRAMPGVAIESGNHGLRIEGRKPLLSRCDALTVFHFPLRDVEQYRCKIRQGAAALARNARLPQSVGITWRELAKMESEGRLEAHLDGQLQAERELATRVESGELVLDERFARYMDEMLAGLRGATPCAPQ